MRPDAAAISQKLEEVKTMPALMGQVVPPDDEDAAAGNDPEAMEYAYKAKALYAYTASPDDPTDISFSEGELLYIVNDDTEWWQARKEDGTAGTVPSSEYLLIAL
ncbi:Transmembrane osmosensor [Ceratobasidium sp. 428]|nr:Transmembrane osmosensor [Ceratobasidium sp. 428]